MCYVHNQEEMPDGHVTNDRPRSASTRAQAAVFVAVPARDDKKAEVYQFPDERLKYVVPRAQSKDTGKLLSLKTRGAWKIYQRDRQPSVHNPLPALLQVAMQTLANKRRNGHGR